MPFEIDGKFVNKTLLHLVPHGINPKIFFPIDKKDQRLVDMRKNVFRGKKYDFVLFYNSRNIHRKRTSNIILAFRTFCDNLPPDESKKCCLVMHTEMRLNDGTDLVAVKEALCPKYDIYFSEQKVAPEVMNLLYNLADITVNASSSEGFGLSTAESMMAGTPIIVNVTGGLQDQIGQLDDDGKPIEFNAEFGSNNCGKYKKNYGVWVKPIWPATRMIQGSPQTPYILDDIGKWEDIADAYMYWYLIPNEKREEYGLKGREWALGEGRINSDFMCKTFILGMEYTFNNFKPMKPFDVFTTKDFIGHNMPESGIGLEIPKIDKDKIQNEIREINNKV